MRLFPNMVVMAPGDELDVAPMLRFALEHTRPTSLRYPKASLEKVERPVQPIELGQAEVFEWGTDAMLIAYGTLFPTCVKAAEKLREEGYDVGVINARFVKPLDQATMFKAVRETAAGRHGRGRHAGRRLRQRRSGSGQRRRGSTRGTSSASAFPTASSSTASAANCSPTWAWTSTASAGR